MYVLVITGFYVFSYSSLKRSLGKWGANVPGTKTDATKHAKQGSKNKNKRGRKNPEQLTEYDRRKKMNRMQEEQARAEEQQITAAWTKQTNKIEGYGGEEKIMKKEKRAKKKDQKSKTQSSYSRQK